MGLLSLSDQYSSSQLLKLGGQACLILAVAGLSWFAYKGYLTRAKFRKMKAQGLVGSTGPADAYVLDGDSSQRPRVLYH